MINSFTIKVGLLIVGAVTIYLIGEVFFKKKRDKDDN